MAACSRNALAGGLLKHNHLNKITRGIVHTWRSGSREASSSAPLLAAGETSRKTSQHTSLVKDAETAALRHHDYFKVRGLVQLEELFEHRCHLGHKTGCRNPFMAPYLFGSRMGVDIIDIEKTLPLFQDALNFLAHVAYRKGIILFISRNKQSIPWIEKVAQNCGEYAHCRYWSHATFLDSQAEAGQVIRLPDLVIFVNTQNSAFETHSAVRHTSKLLIPSIGIVDTNCSPQLVSYPIPGNDDSPTAIKYYLSLFEETIMLAKERHMQDEEESELQDKY